MKFKHRRFRPAVTRPAFVCPTRRKNLLKIWIAEALEGRALLSSVPWTGAREDSFISTTAIDLNGQWYGTETDNPNTQNPIVVPLSGTIQQAGEELAASLTNGPYPNGFVGRDGYTGTISGNQAQLTPGDDYITFNTAFLTVSTDGNGLSGYEKEISGGVVLNPAEAFWDLKRVLHADLSGEFLMSGATAPPATLAPGQSATVGFNLSNAGPDEASGTYSVRFQLVPQSGGGPAESVGNASGPIELGSGRTTANPIAAALDVPRNVPPGTYDLAATLSDGGGITDVDTQDKTFMAGPITVALADLSGEFVTQPPIAMSPGDSSTVAFTINNIGQGNATGTIFTDFYLETSPQPGGLDVPLGQVQSAVNLNPAQTQPSTFTFQLPANTPAGTYYVVAVIRTDASIIEARTDNNSFASQSIEVGNPDLTGNFLIPPPNYLSSQSSVSASYEINNQGMGKASGGVTTKFFLETAPQVGAGDVPLLSDSQTIDLDPNGSAQFNVSFTIPASASPGTYYIVGQIMPAFAESNSSNNVFSSGPVNVNIVIPAYSIAGRVFNDQNNNGHLDSGEAGLFGVTVYIDLNHNGRHDAGEPYGLSDLAGNYLIPAPNAGRFTVAQQPPTGYAYTTPVGDAATVTVGGMNTPGTLFGDVQVASVLLDFSYLLKVAQSYGQPGTFAMGDLNGDGTVNFADLLVLAQNYGRTASGALANSPFALTESDSLERLLERASRRR